MNPYEAIIPDLQNKHFYPNKTITMSKKGEECTGLWLGCPPILSDSKLDKLRAALPDGFIADYLPNLQEIHITIKK
jgi:hypothetical protein